MDYNIRLKQIINRFYGKMSQHNFIYADTDSILYSDCDVAETTELISLLAKMTCEERMRIANAGYITASRMTDHNMAIDYLQKLENI